MHLQIATEKMLDAAPGPVAIAQAFAGRKNHQEGKPADGNNSYQLTTHQASAVSSPVMLI